MRELPTKNLAQVSGGNCGLGAAIGATTFATISYSEQVGMGEDINAAKLIPIAVGGGVIGCLLGLDLKDDAL